MPERGLEPPRGCPHRNLNAPASAVTIENSSTTVRQDASECVRSDTDTGAVPQNFVPGSDMVSAPLLETLGAACTQWAAIGGTMAIRKILLGALEAVQGVVSAGVGNSSMVLPDACIDRHCSYNVSVSEPQFEWDSKKDRENQKKHRI
jgi:hypothetical protein